MSVLGYLPKQNRDLGLASSGHFLHDFSIKCYLFNTLSMDKVSMSYLLSFSRYETKVPLSSYLNSSWRHKL